ncbi:MAG: M13 family metallopeptidase [Flavobacteriales bacterium]|nr:M13 family metallopeptidase [Flavobacteriales bacterium]
MQHPFTSPARVLAYSLALIMTACGEGKKTTGEETAGESKPAGPVGFDIAYMDTTVSPCANFEQFAVGNWIKNNPVPSTESRWGSFNILGEENNERLKGLLEELLQKENLSVGSYEQVAADYYYSALDTDNIEKKGASDLKAQLEEINAITSLKELTTLSANLQTKGVRNLFGFFVAQDDRNSSQYISQLYQGGLGLPDRDYYFNTDDRSKMIRDEYLKHLATMFKLIGADEATAAAKAKTVMDIETKLAKASRTRIELRDPEKNYNKMPLAKLKSLAPSLDWDAFLAGAGVNSEVAGEFVVGQPEFFKALQVTLTNVKLDDWKTYMIWHLLEHSSVYLSSDFVNADFAFYNTVLRGTKEQKTRWKKALQMTNGALGEALGRAFVGKYFPPSSKKYMEQMVENLRSAFRERINGLTWMSDSTKASALKKLEAFTYKIGYPNKWKDFSSLHIDRESLVLNSQRASQYEFKEMVDKLGKPIDKDEWFMSPQTVNAYYSPNQNEIVFPAGILMPPFYNPNADDAVNYGGIGAVIGHEFTHGFDDQGSKYDGSGNLNNWWSDEDRKRFDDRSGMVVSQFNQFEALPGEFVNGSLTLGENIADLGGLILAYYALEKSYEGKEKPADIDGYNYHQRFFFGWANVWKQNINDAELSQRLVTDPHAPGRQRILGPLANISEFKEAFGCSEGDAMVQSGDKRAVIW